MDVEKVLGPKRIQEAKAKDIESVWSRKVYHVVDRARRPVGSTGQFLIDLYRVNTR